MKSLLLAPLLALVCSCTTANLHAYADKLAPLIDPAKLATLGVRKANPRVQKAVAILADAEAKKLDSAAVCAAAIQQVNMSPAAGALTQAALLRNLDTAKKLGCLDAAGLDEMRHGKAATIQHGHYQGDQLSVDHVLPLSLVPELDNVIANLELMPLRMNQSKNAKVGQRQLSFAEKFHAAGLLSKDGLEKVKRAARNP